MFGVDPGATVGGALYVRGRFDCFQLAPADALEFMRGWLTRQLEHGETYVVGAAERYTRGSVSGTHRSTQPDAEDFTARLDQLCLELAPPPFVDRPMVTMYLQGAGDAKTTVSDAVLRRCGWYTPGHRHANDAARHLGLRMLHGRPEEYARVLAGEFIDLNTVIVEKR
jgi:hypothetical protein